MLLFLLACVTTSTPCTDYCDYICDCHAGEAGYDCDECYTVSGGDDPQLQDECETALSDLRSEDDQNGHTCGGAGDDTAAG